MKCKKQNGYTLIELVVAIAIFVTFIVAASTIFINLLRESRKATQQRVLTDQAHNLIEQIQYDLQNAQPDYLGTENCLGTGVLYPRTFAQASSDQLVFIDEDGVCTGYALNNEQVVKIRDVQNLVASTVIPMTDPSIAVNAIQFRIYEDGLESQQPLVHIFIELESVSNDGIPPIGLQASVSLMQNSVYNTCSVGIGEEGTYCPFVEDDLPPGSVVVDFRTAACIYPINEPDSCIQADTSIVQRASTQTVPVNIPAGTYLVRLVGHDPHKQDALGASLVATQPNESYFVYLNSTNSSYGIRTDASSDIPDAHDCSIDNLINPIVIAEDIEEAQACHGDVTWGSNPDCTSITTASTNPNSLRVVCAAFIPVN